MSGKSSEERRRRILIVDDQPLATHVLGRLLGRHGYLAAEVNDPTKALRVAHRFLPDAAILDVHMPWKDGHEVAADFRADEALCNVPIIFITGDRLEQAAPTMSIPVLLKPFSIDDLFALLKDAIARKDGQQAEKGAGRELFTGSNAG
jgi:CheY-like chemotaxis protein